MNRRFVSKPNRVPYFSNALQLQFDDPEAMAAFLSEPRHEQYSSPDAEHFSRVAIEFLDSPVRRWQSAPWSLLHRLSHATKITVEASDFRFAGAGATALVGAISDPRVQLTSLNISHKALTGVDVTALAEALGKVPTHLTFLDFSENTVGEPDALALAQVLRNPRSPLSHSSLRTTFLGERSG